MFDSVRHFIAKHIPFESVITSNDSIFDRAPSKKDFFNPKFSDINFVCFLTFLMAVGRSRSKTTSVPATPEQRQEVVHEEESGGSDVGDQEDENDSLKKEVKDLSVKLNQVISAVEKLTQ